jgi:hypothetical protein
MAKVKCSWRTIWFIGFPLTVAVHFILYTVCYNLFIDHIEYHPICAVPLLVLGLPVIDFVSVDTLKAMGSDRTLLVALNSLLWSVAVTMFVAVKCRRYKKQEIRKHKMIEKLAERTKNGVLIKIRKNRQPQIGRMQRLHFARSCATSRGGIDCALWPGSKRIGR